MIRCIKSIHCKAETERLMTYCNNGLLMIHCYTHICFVTSACCAGQSSLLLWVLFLHQLALLAGYQWKKKCTSAPLNWCRIITFGIWLDLRQSVTNFLLLLSGDDHSGQHRATKARPRPCNELGGLMLDSHFPWFPKFCGRAGWQDLSCTDLLAWIRQAAKAQVWTATRRCSV